MTWPASLTLITVRADYSDALGNALANDDPSRGSLGEVEFLPSKEIRDMTDQIIIKPEPIRVQLYSDGTIALELPVNDSPQLHAADRGFTYQVSERLLMLPTATYVISLSSILGTSVDLSKLKA